MFELGIELELEMEVELEVSIPNNVRCPLAAGSGADEGHTTKRGLRVPNPNSRSHATKRGFGYCPGFSIAPEGWGPKGVEMLCHPFILGGPNKGDKIRSQNPH